MLLSNETFHRFNRAALLGILFFSTVLPLIEISSSPQQPAISENIALMLQMDIVSSNVTAIMPMQQPEATRVTLTWLHLLMLIYIAGIIFLTVRSIYSVIRLCMLVKSGKRQTLDNRITLVVHSSHIAPFSWFRHIIISEKDFEENGNEIIIHEKAHIDKRHSTDLLICHIYNILQWINPVAWLFKRELQNIHEYEADEAVLKQGINTKQYQLLLIRKAAGAKLFALANNFNKNKLQKRIIMMSKNKSNPYSRLKYLYVLPMFAIVITAFANTQVKNEMEKISSVGISDFMWQNEDGQNANKNAADSIMLTVFNQTQIGDSTDESNTAQMSLTASLTAIAHDSVAEQQFRKKINADAIIIVDGKIIDSIGDIDESSIKTISVIKNVTQAKKDGDVKKHFIYITTSGDSDNLRAYADFDSISGINGYYFHIKTENAFDSITEINENVFANMKNIYIDSLYKPHFRIIPNLRNDSLSKVWDFNLKSWNDSLSNIMNYYSKSRNDSLSKVWDFNLKSWNDSLSNIMNYYSKSRNDSLLNAFNFNLKSWNDSVGKTNLNYYFNWNSDKSADLFDSNILIIVDGKEVKFDEFAKMGEQIGTISVLKDKEAVKKYGIKASKGVIIVETKK
jgi:beta-lactamase regulating signal transducer with metallopeptidase domain